MSQRLRTIAQKLFERPSLGLLAAGGCTRMVACRLPPEHRAPFDELHDALRRWLPGEDRAAIVDLYWRLFPACMQVCLHYNKRSHPSDATMSAAYLQFRCLLPMLGRVLPADGFYDMSFEDFFAIAKRTAKPGTSATVLAHRFERILELESRPWSEQCEAVDRMLWELPVKETAFAPRLRRLVLHLSVGGAWSWREMSGARLLHFQGEGGAVSLVLSAEERAALAALCPALAAADDAPR